jgi:hypothetical protein
MACASEAHLLISNLDESPFNVGTQISLQDFTDEEVAELNSRHGKPLCDEEFKRLKDLVGGQPYLVQRSLCEMKALNTDITHIEAESNRVIGIFSDHLHRVGSLVSQDPGLEQAIQTLIAGATIRDNVAFVRLHSAGILKGNSMEDAKFRYGLYKRYFERQFPTV